MPQSIVSRQWTVIFQLLLIAIPHETTISFSRRISESLRHFALICPEMSTFVVSKCAKNKWEVL